MASVTNSVTRWHDVEGTLTLTSIGGGAGASANTDAFIQGSQSAGRRVSNATDKGFWLTRTAGSVDLSAADVHIGMWLWCTHYPVLTGMKVRYGAGQTNYDEHTVPLSLYPPLGGWVRAWVDISRTPEATGGSGLNEASVSEAALLMSLPTVGGNADNVIMDSIGHTTTGYLLTGTSGVWQDFLTYEQNSSNRFGVLRVLSGVIYVQARLTLGSSSSLVFSDSAFVMVFPDQSLVADTFMGVTVDLQHASTSVTWTNGVLRSAGTKLGDLIVTGTAGTFTASSMTIASLRVVTLTSACSVTDSSFTSCGAITAPGSTLTSSQILTPTVAADASGLVWDVATDTDGKLDGMTFSKGTNAHHAIEFGTNSPTSFTLRNITFSGFTNTIGDNAAPLHIKRTSGSVSISASGCAGITANGYKTDGATVTITLDTRTVKLIVVDVDGVAVTGANAFLRAAAGGPFPYQASVTITRSGTTATVAHTGHGIATGDKVLLSGITDKVEDNGVQTITYIDANSYSYPTTDSGSTSYTGTITSTFVFLKGLANGGAGSNEISMSRAIPANQPVVGWARKGTGSPIYKPGPVSGSVSSTGDTTFSAVMISDE